MPRWHVGHGIHAARTGAVDGLVVHQADIQDRDGAPCVLASIRSLYPLLRHTFADGGYAGEKLREAPYDVKVAKAAREGQQALAQTLVSSWQSTEDGLDLLFKPTHLPSR
jgi:hypothetical protein